VSGGVPPIHYLSKVDNNTNLEEFFQIVELTVDVSANRDRGSHLLHVRFLNQNFLCLFIDYSLVFSFTIKWLLAYLFTELLHFSFGQRLAFHQSLDLLVQGWDVGHF
jgi:hypothetical protein